MQTNHSPCWIDQTWFLRKYLDQSTIGVPGVEFPWLDRSMLNFVPCTKNLRHPGLSVKTLYYDTEELLTCTCTILVIRPDVPLERFVGSYDRETITSPVTAEVFACSHRLQGPAGACILKQPLDMQIIKASSMSLRGDICVQYPLASSVMEGIPNVNGNQEDDDGRNIYCARCCLRRHRCNLGPLQR